VRDLLAISGKRGISLRLGDRPPRT